MNQMKPRFVSLAMAVGLAMLGTLALAQSATITSAVDGGFPGSPVNRESAFTVNVYVSANTTGYAPAMCQLRFTYPGDSLEITSIVASYHDDPTYGDVGVYASPSLPPAEPAGGNLVTSDIGTLGDLYNDITTATLLQVTFKVKASNANPTATVSVSNDPDGVNNLAWWDNPNLQFVEIAHTFNNSGTTNIPLAVAPDINVTPLSRNFGAYYGSDLTQTVTIQNTIAGGDPLTITNLQFTGAQASAFTLDAATPALPFQIAGGANKVITLHFNPVVAGASTAALEISHDDPDDPSPVSVSLSGSTEAVVKTSVVETQPVDCGATMSVNVFVDQNSGASTPHFTALRVHFTSGTLTLTNIIASMSEYATYGTPDPGNAVYGQVGVYIGSGLPPAVSDPSPGDPNRVYITVATAGDLQNQDKTPELFQLQFTVNPLNDVDKTTVEVSNDPGTTDNLTQYSTATLTTTEIPHIFNYSASTDIELDTFTPDVNLNPASLAFGGVYMNTTSTKTFDIENNGDDPLTISAITLTGSDSGAYSFDPAPPSTPFVIAGLGKQTISVKFAPTSLGSYTNAQVEVSHNDPLKTSPQVVDLDGTGVAGDIAFDPTAVAFGNVVVNQTPTQTFDIENNGTGPLTISSLSITGTDAARYSLVSPPSVPFQVNVSAVQTITVRFSPTALGATSAKVQVGHNDPFKATPQEVNLSGTGVAPDIAIAPTARDFGNVVVGQTPTMTFDITNNGTSALHITGLSIVGGSAGAYSVVSPATPVTIGIGLSATVTVQFDPPAVGTYNDAQVSVVHDDPFHTSPQYVDLDGSGVAPAISLSSSLLDFGDVVKGQVSDKSFTIENTGSSNLTISSIGLAGADAGKYSFLSPPATPFQIAPTGTQIISVRFTPAAVGTFNSASVQIGHDGQNTASPASVGLNGKGVIPAIAAAPASLSFGTVPEGNSSTRNLIVENTGEAPLTISTLEFSGFFTTNYSFDPNPTLPLNIAPSGSTNLTVKFTSPGAGTFNEILYIYHDGQNTASPLNVDLFSTGTAPGVFVSPGSVDYGNVILGQTPTQLVTISNTGSADLTITSLGIVGTESAPYSLVSPPSTPFVIGPSGSQQVTVQFAPVAAGLYDDAKLQVGHNATNTASPVDVPLSGTGVVADIDLSPATTAFGNLYLGLNSTKTFDIVNTGTSVLSVTSITLGGTNAASFALVSPPATPFNINPGLKHTISVNFEPMAVGPLTAKVTIASNDPDEPSVEENLTGTGEVFSLPNQSYALVSGATAYTQAETVIGQAVSTTDIINGMTGAVSGAGFHPATVPADAIGRANALANGLWDANSLTVIGADTGNTNPSFVIEYNFVAANLVADITEIRVFSGHDSGGDRSFINCKVEIDTGSGYTQLGSDNLRSGPFGLAKPNNPAVALVTWTDPGTLAQDVQKVRFTFYCVSHNSTGYFQAYNDNAAPANNYPNQGTIVKEIDVLGTTSIFNALGDWTMQ